MMKRQFGEPVLASSLFLVFALAGTCRAGVLNFDELPTGSAPGDYYAHLGLNFSFGELSGVVGVGNAVEFNSLTAGFEIVSGPFAISGTNAASTRNGLVENLLAFDQPVFLLSLITDDAFAETTADIVRLIALEPTPTPLRFTVIDFMESLDDATTSPQNIMALSIPGGARFFAFQRTTEPESFDNLSFTMVPEPTSFTIFGLAVIGLGIRQRRKHYAWAVLLHQGDSSAACKRTPARH